MTTGGPLRILIVDDEPLARQRLRQLLAQVDEPRCEVVGEAGNAPQTLELMGHLLVDAVLLDIRMPGLDGLHLARLLRGPAGTPAPAIVFVTAHDEHALRAFDVEALDYLTKPVQAPRLRQALRRVEAGRAAAVAPAAMRDMPAPANGAVTAAADDAEVLVISDRQRLLRIPLSEIVTARAGHKLVTLTTLTREYVIDESLADLEQRLGRGFLRIHRNALVARHAARELVRRSGETAEDGWVLRVMPGNVWVPVSRRLVAMVRDALGAA